jgi:hypothetical protein
MKIVPWMLAAVLAVALAPVAAQAALSEDQFTMKTTGDLIALCTADPKDPLYTAAVNYCHGFATGAYSAEQAHEAATKAKPLFCLPDPRPTRAQAVADFVAWTKEDPARLDLPPVHGMFTFLMQRYPCPGSARGKPHS